MVQRGSELAWSGIWGISERLEEITGAAAIGVAVLMKNSPFTL